jgi:hypothetical protein
MGNKMKEDYLIYTFCKKIESCSNFRTNKNDYKIIMDFNPIDNPQTAMAIYVVNMDSLNFEKSAVVIKEDSNISSQIFKFISCVTIAVNKKYIEESRITSFYSELFLAMMTSSAINKKFSNISASVLLGEEHKITFQLSFEGKKEPVSIDIKADEYDFSLYSAHEIVDNITAK